MALSARGEPWHRLGMSDQPSVTVEELLPALVELASIQHDLLSLDLPAPGVETSRAETLYRARSPGIGTTIEARLALQKRSRELLVWLLAKTRVQK
jgi:hypothetical protein